MSDSRYFYRSRPLARLIERFSIGDGAGLSMALAKFDESLWSDGAFEVEVEFGLRKRVDEGEGHDFRL
jgi:hypothetical protein